MLIFVYGTLMKGESNHHLLEGPGATFMMDAETQPEFTMINVGRYPGILPGGETAIKGEVYAVNHETLMNLDRLEGHPRFYMRTPIVLSNGAPVETYFYPERGRGMPEIVSGSWRTK